MEEYTGYWISYEMVKFACLLLVVKWQRSSHSKSNWVPNF